MWDPIISLSFQRKEDSAGGAPGDYWHLMMEGENPRSSGIGGIVHYQNPPTSMIWGYLQAANTAWEESRDAEKREEEGDEDDRTEETV